MKRKNMFAMILAIMMCLSGMITAYADTGIFNQGIEKNSDFLTGEWKNYKRVGIVLDIPSGTDFTVHLQVDEEWIQDDIWVRDCFVIPADTDVNDTDDFYNLWDSAVDQVQICGDQSIAEDYASGYGYLTGWLEDDVVYFTSGIAKYAGYRMVFQCDVSTMCLSEITKETGWFPSGRSYITVWTEYTDENGLLVKAMNPHMFFYTVALEMQLTDEKGQALSDAEFSFEVHYMDEEGHVSDFDDKYYCCIVGENYPGVYTADPTESVWRSYDTPIRTDEAGKIKISGLYMDYDGGRDGTVSGMAESFRLMQIKTADGYLPLEHPVEIQMKTSISETGDLELTATAWIDGESYALDCDTDACVVYLPLVNPELDSEPEKPEEPETPTKPSEPEEPEKPNESDVSTPSEATPSIPDIPIKPTPSEPDKPGEDILPEPETPSVSTPSEPGKATPSEAEPKPEPGTSEESPEKTTPSVPNKTSGGNSGGSGGGSSKSNRSEHSGKQDDVSTENREKLIAPPVVDCDDNRLPDTGEQKNGLPKIAFLLSLIGLAITKITKRELEMQF